LIVNNLDPLYLQETFNRPFDSRDGELAQGRPQVEYDHGATDFLLETDLNHVPQRQKLSGAAAR
jgi:hypothetical protein